MRRLTLALVVAVGILAASCGGDAPDEPAAPEGAEQTTEASAPPTEAALLLPGDFEQVCGGGTIAGAAAFEKAPGVHPVLVFEGQDPEFEYMSLTLPEGWQSESVSVADTQLVGCLDRVEEKKVKVCEDYESDDFPEPFDVELYSATWDVTLYEANTGEEVASGQISAEDKDCPLIVFRDEDEDVQREYADPSDQFRGFVKKYVAP